MPAGEIRHADVAELARANEAVERGKDFLLRRHRIETVQLKQIDVIVPSRFREPSTERVR